VNGTRKEWTERGKKRPGFLSKFRQTPAEVKKKKKAWEQSGRLRWGGKKSRERSLNQQMRRGRNLLSAKEETVEKKKQNAG